MKILILGANGFIGSEVAARLAADGHELVGLTRSGKAGAARLSLKRIIAADLAEMSTPERWLKALDGIDIIVNCAGALQETPRDRIAETQSIAMRAMYQAARHLDIERIVQISARTDGDNADLPFLATKADADRALAESGLDHVILRPALVIGRNAHGGTALLRALSALPFVVPLVHADSPIAVISMDDVTEAVSRAVEGTLDGTDYDLATEETFTLETLVRWHRAWLGLKDARIIAVPGVAGRVAGWCADLAGRLGWRSPLRTTAQTILSGGITTSGNTLPFRMLSIPSYLRNHPAGAQDGWFARLYLLKPVLVIALALFWILSGAIALLDPNRAAHLMEGFATPLIAMVLTLSTALIDIGLGALILRQDTARTALIGQIVVASTYLILGTLLSPALWADPLGPYVKILPALAASLATLAIIEER